MSKLNFTHCIENNKFNVTAGTIQYKKYIKNTVTVIIQGLHESYKIS